MHILLSSMARPAALALLLCSGCAPSPDFGGASVDVEACSGDSDVEDTLSLVLAFGDSAHEMVVCGAIAYQFLGAVVGSAGFFSEGNADWQERLFFEEGTYRVEGSGVTMDLALAFGDDSQMGAPGERILANLFIADSWLVDATAAQDGDDLVVSFAEPGPLAELLGKGADPQSPLTFSPEDLDAVALTLTTLLLEVRIELDDQQARHRYAYNITSPAASIESLLIERTLAYELDEAFGARPNLDQLASVSSWDLRYRDGPNPALQGTVSLDITGGPFAHAATYLYLAEDPEPSVSITCR